MKQIFLFLLLFVLHSCQQPLKDDGLSGTAVKIPDGDTFTLLTPGKKSIRIRLFGIDAPEKGQDFYQVSRDYLGSLLEGKTLTVQVRDTDRYQRIVGDVYLPDNRYVNRLMVEAGLAWHYRQYSKSMELAKAEQQARENRLGLWKQPNAQPPWEWRKEQREGVGK